MFQAVLTWPAVLTWSPGRGLWLSDLSPVLLTKLFRGRRLGVVPRVQQQRDQAGVLFQIAGGKRVVAGREADEALLPRRGLVAIGVGFPGGGVNVHAFNFTGVGGWAEGKRHVFAVGQFHGDGLPFAELDFQESVFAVNLFLTDDFHKAISRRIRQRQSP